MRKIGDHVVVLGVSMSGLLAARVLADAYQRVTVVERDLLPEHGADRKGVPQLHPATLAHVLTGNLRRRPALLATAGSTALPPITEATR